MRALSAHLQVRRPSLIYHPCSLLQSVGLTDSSVEKATKDLSRLEERPLLAASTAAELKAAMEHVRLHESFAAQYSYHRCG